MAEKNPKDQPEVGQAPSPFITLEALGQLRELFASDLDKARSRDLDNLRRKQALEDVQREKLGSARVVAITSYTAFDDENPDGRVVKAGDEFDMPRYDLAAFEGKVRLKELDVAPDAGGVKISAS